MCIRDRQRSAALQQKLFEQFRMLNAKGEIKDLCTIFEQTVHKIPPAGAGECALPKLLQYAYLHQLKPLAMAEFWWGNSPKTEVRHHGYYYPCLLYTSSLVDGGKLQHSVLFFAYPQAVRENVHLSVNPGR